MQEASRPGKLVVISGPSGVGKTTITRAINEHVSGTRFSVSATTRAKTDADREGIDYHFLGDEAFDKSVREGAFLEHAEYAGRRYGTLRGPVESAMAQGYTMLLEIDVQGAEQVKRSMPEAFAVFVLPPSEEDLLERLRNRNREGEEAIQRRFRIAKDEIARAKACGAYDLFIVNDDLERATREAIDAVRSLRTGSASKA